MDPAWATGVRDQCVRANVPFKQWGGFNKKRSGRALEGWVWDEMPDSPAVPVNGRRLVVLND